MDHYRSADWASFREEVFKLDDYACTKCGKTRTDGAVLQAHHKQYLPGRKPWDYPYEMCATVCRGCHAAEHGKIPPRFGWEFMGSDDLGGLNGACEYCGESIRYVFLVQHANWRAMEVGEICCGHLTSEPKATEFMDERRRYLGRRKRFVASRRWTVGRDNIHRILYRLMNIEVVPSGGTYKLHVNSTPGKMTFQSAAEAKGVAFDLIASGALEKFLAKKWAALQRY